MKCWKIRCYDNSARRVSNPLIELHGSCGGTMHIGRNRPEKIESRNTGRWPLGLALYANPLVACTRFG